MTESFVPSLEQIKEIQSSGIPETTKKNTTFWVNVLHKYRSNHEFTTPIEEIQNKDQLEKELCQFVVGVRKQDGSEYISWKNAMAALDRHLKENSVIGRDIALTGEQCKHKFPQLYKTVEGKLRDMKRKGLIKKNSAESLSTDEIKQILNHCSTSRDTAEGLVRRIFKNDQGGLLGSSDCLEIPCPCDEPGILGPFYDFNLYISKRPEKCKTKEFYLQVNTSNSDRKIVNHSGRSTCLTWLFQSGLTEKQIMDISGHKSLKALSSTDINEINNQAVNNKNTIIDLEDSYELPKENDDSTSEITQVIEGASMDLNSEIINKLNDKLIDNFNSNCSKRMGGINKIDKHYSNKPFKRPKFLDSTNNYDNRKTVIKKISYKNCNFTINNSD
nr:7019_t:CDS:2 [Entrophospora candida]